MKKRKTSTGRRSFALFMAFVTAITMTFMSSASVFAFADEAASGDETLVVQADPAAESELETGEGTLRELQSLQPAEEQENEDQAAEQEAAAAAAEEASAEAESEASTQSNSLLEAVKSLLQIGDSDQNPVTSEEAASEAEESPELADADIRISSSNLTNSVYDITTGGVYVLDSGLAAAINVYTTDSVTIEGTGCDPFTGNTGTGAYTALSITSAVSGTSITLKDLFITGGNSAAGYYSAENGNTCINVVNVSTGACNLHIEGTCDFEMQNGGAVIHVGQGTSLVMDGGADGEGTLYLYKKGAWAGVGGNGSEVNGKITFNSGNYFMKGSAMGAVIGSGSYCLGTPGDVTINGGTFNLIANARGAIIGLGAGDVSGAFSTDSGNLYVNGGSVNVNLDWTGAIGPSGNSAGPNEGSVTDGRFEMNGGSFRTYIDQNTASRWGMSAGAVSDCAIIKNEIENSAGENIYFCAVDTSMLDVTASAFDVYLDEANTTYFSGGLHEYCFINEANEKGAQAAITNTTTNWLANNDTNLYFYLTGEDHSLKINDEYFDATWDEDTDSFTITEGTAPVPEPEYNYDWYYNNNALVSDGDSEADPYLIGTKSQLKAFAALVNGTYTPAAIGESTAAAKNFQNKYVRLTSDIALEADNLYTVTDATYGQPSYTVNTSQYAISTTASLWTPIGTGVSTTANTVSSGNYFAGTFDGAGHTISGLYTDGTARVQGLFGCVSGTIRNLSVTGCVCAHSIAGGICAFLNGGKIENCTNYANVFTDGGTTPNGGVENGLSQAGANGGIVGRAAGVAGAPFTLQKNYNYGNIINGNSNKGGRTGGIAGLVETSQYGSITKNVNFGRVDAYQYSGGIVGMNMASAVPVTYCGNVGNIIAQSPGSTYTGGISAKCQSGISYCFNTGEIRIRKYGTANTKVAHAGGIVSDFVQMNGQKITNCYNTGLVVYEGYNINTVCTSWGTIVGTGYGYSAATFTVEDCLTTQTENNIPGYDLTRGEDYNYIQNNNMGSGYIDLVSEGALTTAANLAILNGSGAQFVPDTQNINGGNPVFRWMTSDSVAPVSITLLTGPSVTAYVEGQTFDAYGTEVQVAWPDGVNEILPVSELNVSNTNALTLSDSAVTISGKAGTTTFSFNIPITVSETQLSSIAVTPGRKTLYCSDENYDPAGMVVTATYTSGITAALSQYDGVNLTNGYTYTYDKATGTVTVSYIFKETEKTASFTVTSLSSPVPTKTGGYYLLGNSDNLLWFMYNVNTNGNVSYDAKLTADIDMSDIAGFAGIGTSSYKYAGEFDGQGHKITVNLSGDNKGIFGYTNGADIKNLTAAGSVSGSKYVAGIAANTLLTTFTDCVNEATVSCTGTSGYAGGITAIAEGVIFTGCINKGNISGTKYIGGIMGYCKGKSGSAMLIQNCGNEGTITATSTNAGGIAGYIIDASGATTATVDSCYNRGNVTSTGNYAGGIASYVKAAYITISLTNLYNKGNVTASSYVGGILGTAYNTKQENFSNFYNSGTVSSSANTASYLGAVMGQVYKATFTASNLYYLTGSCAQGIGSSSTGKPSVTAKSDSEMKDSSFVTTMGAGYKKGGTYPLLAWQENDFATFTVVNSDDNNITIAGVATGDTALTTVTFTVECPTKCIAFISQGGVVVPVESQLAEGEHTFEADVENGPCELSVYRAGDADCDGSISITDASALVTSLRTGISLGIQGEYLANVDEEDGLSLNDTFCILNYLYGKGSISW